MFKYLTHSYPDHLQAFPTVRDITDSTARHRDHLYIPKTNTDLGARSFSVRGPTLWNSLPSRVISSLNLKLYLMKTYFDIVGLTGRTLHVNVYFVLIYLYSYS